MSQAKELVNIAKDLNAIVISFGSHSTKAGEAGEDLPKVVVPTSVGFIDGPSKAKENAAQSVLSPTEDSMDLEPEAPLHVPAKRKDQMWVFGTTELNHYQDYLEIIQHPIKNGVVTNWDAIEKLLDYIVTEQLHIDPQTQPFLLSESSFTPKDQREKFMELLFEKFNVPAYFVSKEATLSAYASGRSTALIVDCGADMSVVSAVHDGYVLQKSIMRSPIAGNRLTELVQNSVQARMQEGLRPRYLFAKKKGRTKFDVVPIQRAHATQSYHQYQIWQVLNDIKESVCYVSDTTNSSTTMAGQYELPDGTPLYLDTDRPRIPESLFTPQPQLAGGVTQTLPQMVNACLANCDTDLRRELYGSLVITGGTTLFNGFTSRLTKEIEVPQIFNLKTIVPTDAAERRFSTWIGGSILGSLGSFQQMWISKKEYEESGKELVHKRCP